MVEVGKGEEEEDEVEEGVSRMRIGVSEGGGEDKELRRGCREGEDGSEESARQGRVMSVEGRWDAVTRIEGG